MQVAVQIMVLQRHLFVFGKNVIPGVVGNTPAIPANAAVGDNLPFQYDFRSVYATMLENWLCVKNEDLQTIMLKNFQTLPLVNAGACKTVAPDTSGEDFLTNYPNPFTHKNYYKVYNKRRPYFGPGNGCYGKSDHQFG